MATDRDTLSGLALARRLAAAAKRPLICISAAMLVGPIFSTELIASARRTRFYLWRVLYAGLLLAVLIVVYLTSFGLSGADTISAAAEYARNFFHGYAVLQLLAVLMLGPALAAGSIARERERRTIEYLFTTHLTSAEIVLNKLTAAVVQIAAGVLVGVPVLALAMLLGGIAPDVLLAVSLITLSTIAAVVALSMICSVTARRARDAVARTYVLLFVLILGPLLVRALVSGLGVSAIFDVVVEAMNTAHPFAVLSTLFSAPGSAGGYSPSPVVDRWSQVWWMVAVHGGLAIAAIVFCAWILRRVKLEAATATTGEQRRGRRFRPQLGEYPLIWKEMFAGRSYRRAAQWARRLQWLVVFAAVIGSVWQYLNANMQGNPRSFLIFAQGFGLLLECAALLLVAAWASNSIAVEREQETWTMLVSTPLSGKEILAGKVAGSLYAARMLLPPLVVLWLLSALDEVRLLAALPFTIGALFVLAISSALVGVCYSLWCTNGTRALAATLGSGLAVVVAGSCCCPFTMVNPLYLLGFPGMAGILSLEQKFDSSAVLAIGGIYGTMWVVGMALHVGLICLLWVVGSHRFDRLAGRFHFAGPNWASPDAKIVAQYVPENSAADSMEEPQSTASPGKEPA